MYTLPKKFDNILFSDIFKIVETSGEIVIIPQSFVQLDVRQIKLVESIGIANAALRNKGREREASTLCRLRTKIREGLSFEEAKPFFDLQAKSLFEEKN